jgi:hypothetical protein
MIEFPLPLGNKPRHKTHVLLFHIVQFLEGATHDVTYCVRTGTKEIAFRYQDFDCLHLTGASQLFVESET